MSSALWLVVASAVCPASTPVSSTPGLEAATKLPAAEAMRLNGEGKQLYRQERWEEARAKYQAAIATDPDLLGAQLNIACSLSRQGRYGEAADETASLIRRAFVPWNRETLEAADLGILQDQAAYARVKAARTEAAVVWGRAVRDGILFVARTKPPVRVAGQGILALGLNQEVFSWIPETGRYFQVTAEDGRVLAFALSADKTRIVYLLAGKLVRTAEQLAFLRGLSLRVLDLSTMSPGKIVPIPDDVKKVQLWFSSVPRLKVTDPSDKTTNYGFVDDRFEVVSPSHPSGNLDTVDLSAIGVEPGTRHVARPKCGFHLATQKNPDGEWRVNVSRPGVKPFHLDTRYGAGLAGLPFPDEAPRTKPGADAGKK
ncbi:MAG TPA: hypothetical protein VIM14_03090 [Polyangia bacterium]